MDEIKKDFLAGSKKVIVGSKSLDLVLRTLGKVYVQQGNKLVTLQDLIGYKDSGNVDIEAHNSDPHAHPAIQQKLITIHKSKYQLPLLGEANKIYFTTDIGATYIWDEDKYINVGQDTEQINIINGNIW